jgi:hypothetical protein
VIYRSAIRSALDPSKRNQRFSLLGGETTSNFRGDKIFLRSIFDNTLDNEDIVSNDDDPGIKRRMVTIDPKDLIGQTFLKDTKEDGQRFRARVVRVITDREKEVQKILSI